MESSLRFWRVSLATEEPDEATQKMVDEVRIPKGETVLAASH